jgi:NAD(P)H-hydrate epimerase
VTAGATREQAQALDAAAIALGVPVEMLMALAGYQVAVLARRLALESAGPGAQVAVVAGRGNNGGDALVCARHLMDWGLPTRVLIPVPADELGGTAGLARAAHGAGAELLVLGDGRGQSAERAISGASLVVDGLLGTGSRGAPREPTAAVISRVNRSSAEVLSVDLPSGLDADTGEVLGECVRAHHTLMLGVAKAGCLAPGARHWVGRGWLADIGIPREAYIRAGLAAPGWRAPEPLEVEWGS